MNFKCRGRKARQPATVHVLPHERLPIAPDRRLRRASRLCFLSETLKSASVRIGRFSFVLRLLRAVLARIVQESSEMC